MDGLLAAAIGLVGGVVSTPLARRLALARGIVDHPGALKTQRVPVAYLGGVAVFVAAAAGPVIAGRPAILVPMALALALGLADDVRPLPVAPRIVAELLIAAAAAAAVPGSWLARLATAVLVLGLLNAVNLLDGQDGLAAGVGAVSALGFAVLGGAATPVGLALAGALVGFLTLNRPPARIYLGDAGAYLVGTTLAVLPALTGDPSRWSVWWAVPLLVAVPVADTAIAITCRLRSHQPVLLGDRSHVYDQLVDRGMSIGASTTTGIVLQVMFTRRRTRRDPARAGRDARRHARGGARGRRRRHAFGAPGRAERLIRQPAIRSRAAPAAAPTGAGVAAVRRSVDADRPSAPPIAIPTGIAGRISTVAPAPVRANPATRLPYQVISTWARTRTSPKAATGNVRDERDDAAPEQHPADGLDREQPERADRADDRAGPSVALERTDPDEQRDRGRRAPGSQPAEPQRPAHEGERQRRADEGPDQLGVRHRRVDADHAHQPQDGSEPEARRPPVQVTGERRHHRDAHDHERPDPARAPEVLGDADHDRGREGQDHPDDLRVRGARRELRAEREQHEPPHEGRRDPAARPGSRAASPHHPSSAARVARTQAGPRRPSGSGARSDRGGPQRDREHHHDQRGPDPGLEPVTRMPGSP